MDRAYVCMKISEKPPPLGPCICTLFASDGIFSALFAISIAHYFHTPNQEQLVITGRETMACTGTCIHTGEMRTYYAIYFS